MISTSRLLDFSTSLTIPPGEILLFLSFFLSFYLSISLFLSPRHSQCWTEFLSFVESAPNPFAQNRSLFLFTLFVTDARLGPPISLPLQLLEFVAEQKKNPPRWNYFIIFTSFSFYLGFFCDGTLTLAWINCRSTRKEIELMGISCRDWWSRPISWCAGQEQCYPDQPTHWTIN